MKRSQPSKMREQAVQFVSEELIPNSRYYSYQLTLLTSWGFWNENGGEQMISIDSLLGHEIATALLKEVKFAPEHFLLDLNDIFDFIDPDELEEM
jgi:hypothetical protein